MDQFAAAKKMLRRAGVAAGLVVLFVGLPLLAPSAHAGMAAVGACDPSYGCPPPPPPGKSTPECGLSTKEAAPGERVTAHLSKAPGRADVSLLFDGNEVASGTTSAGGAVSMTFRTPEGRGGGHTVVFAGAGFSCDATGGEGFTITSDAVLGESISRGAGGSSLAATGMRLAVYLAVAIVLIVIGAELVKAARQRRREASRQLRHEMFRYTSRK